MKISGIKNISLGVNFKSIDPAIKEKVKRDILRGQSRYFPENNLRYLEDSDEFILKLAFGERGLYSLERIDTEEVVHTGTIEHFLKFDPTEEQMFCLPRPLKNLYPNNFANREFAKLNDNLDVLV